MTTTLLKKPEDAARVLEAFAASTAFKLHQSEAEKRAAAERVRLVACLSAGERATAEKIQTLIKDSAASFARHEQLIAELKAEGVHLNGLTSQRHGVVGAWDQQRARIEAALIESASPEIDVFVGWTKDEEARVLKALPDERPNVSVHPITGRRSVVPPEFKTIPPAERAAALRVARTAALALKLQPDQSRIAEQLGELFNNLPVVGERIAS